MMDFRKKVVVVIGSLLILLLLAVTTQAERGIVITDKYQREAAPSVNFPAITGTTTIPMSPISQTVNSAYNIDGATYPQAGLAMNIAYFGSGSTVYSEIIDLHHTRDQGIEYQCIGATATPDMKIEALQSNERSSTLSDFVECEDGACADVVTNLTDESKHIETLNLTPADFLRIKVTANLWTGSSAYCIIRVFAD